MWNRPISPWICQGCSDIGEVRMTVLNAWILVVLRLDPWFDLPNALAQSSPAIFQPGQFEACQLLPWPWVSAAKMDTLILRSWALSFVSGFQISVFFWERVGLTTKEFSNREPLEHSIPRNPTIRRHCCGGVCLYIIKAASLSMCWSCQQDSTNQHQSSKVINNVQKASRIMQNHQPRSTNINQLD